MLKWWLTASNDLARSFSDYTRRSSSLTDNRFLIGVFLAIGLFWIGLYYWDKHRKQIRRDGHNPKSLFLELCRSHQLSRSERSLLLRVAEMKQLNQPTAIFIDPAILGSLAASSSSGAGEYKALLEKLFGEVRVE